MKKLFVSTALVLALAAVPLTAEARTNVRVGVVIGAPGPVVYRPNRGYSESDIRVMLARQGYRVDYVDRRGGAFFVRAFFGPDIYEGLVGCDDGRWIRRDRIAYRRDRDRGDYRGDYRGRRDWR
jgi:hypothetical protein